MASYTTNLDLEMPTVNEKYDVLKQNQNWQKVDDFAGSVSEQIAKQNIASLFTFETGWAGTINAYCCAGVVHLYVAITTYPTLSNNSVYSAITVANNNRSKPKTNVVAPVYNSSTYQLQGYKQMVAVMNTSQIVISTSSETGDSNNGLRFCMTYLNSEN